MESPSPPPSPEPESFNSRIERLEGGMEERMAIMTAEVTANLMARRTVMFNQFMARYNNVAQNDPLSAILPV